MKFTNIMLVVSIILTCSLITKAQDEILERLKDLKPMISTREDVEKLLGKGQNQDVWATYHYDKATIEITYSNGRCVEGWFAPKDTIIEIFTYFLDERELSELTKNVKLKELRVSNAYDRAGERMYYDDEKGVKYYVDILEKKWSSITYYPSNKYTSCKCEN